MMLAKVDETPLTIVWNMLLDDEAILVLIIDVVPIEPPMLEVKVFTEEERVLEVERLVTLRLVAVALVVMRLVVVAFPNIGLVVKLYITCPLVDVATVRLLLVDEAMKVKRLDTGVVAVTPFTFDVITPEDAVSKLLLTIEEVEVSPFTLDVSVFTKDDSTLELTPDILVVAITPLTDDVRRVEVDVVETERVLPVMIEEVAVTPFMIVVRVFPVAD
jgi:hypothetical protein